MKGQRLMAAAVVLAVGGVVYWLWARPAAVVSKDATDRDQGPAEEAARRAQAGDAQTELPDAPTAVLLDCRQPAGDVARGTKVTVSAADLCADYLRLTGKTGRVTEAIDRRIARDTLDRLLDERLVAAALAEAHTAVSAEEVDAGLARLHMADPTRPEAAEQLKRQGVDVAVVRREVKKRLELERLLTLRAVTEPIDSEIMAEYQAHPERYVKGGVRVSVQAYLARLPRDATPEAVAKALGQAQTFATAVQKQEPDKLAPQLRTVAPLPPFDITDGELEPDLAQAVQKLQPGQWTPPVRTRAGWMVAKVLDRKTGEPRPLREVAAQIVVRLRESRRVSEGKRVLAALRAEAEIAILVQL
ncbi:MAG: peptidyl-prolyl cis-trans isomerase [Deltaproteobacteria bacterium]|nr:peptidyl-prolyl cis-trans isomerase [Deltaproteobacteria bacterium]